MNNKPLLKIANIIFFLHFAMTSVAQNAIYRYTAESVSLKKLIKQVERNPNSLKFNEDYVAANGFNQKLVDKYSALMRRFPKSAILPFIIGREYENNQDPACEKYLLKAVSLDSTLTPAWELLSFGAQALGNTKLAIKYMQHAVIAAPRNANDAFLYAAMHKDIDPVLFDSLMLKVVYHFRDTEKGAQALSLLASYNYNKNEKKAYYEELYNLYSTTEYAWFRAGMKDYYNYLINTDPDEAFHLALKMTLKIKTNRGDWVQKLNVARGFIEAKKLLASNKPGEALVVLNNINLGNSEKIGLMIDAEETLAILKSEAINACDGPATAFKNIEDYYAKYPSGRLRENLLKYGAQMSLDSGEVDLSVARFRDSLAWKPTDFTLENYADNQNVSLSDYRGKIVLLTYWSPSCGPCRAEFPHLEAVLKKINSNNVVYLAINGLTQEEPNVMPLVKSHGYSFIPLKDDRNKSKGNLPTVTSLPSNFLFDQNGRVVFSKFQINDSNEKTLELMITELLKNKSVSKAENVLSAN